MRLPRRLLTALGLLVVTGAAAGCGAKPIDAAAILAAAPAKTAAASTAKVSVDESITEGGTTHRIVMSGAMSLSSGNGTLEADASAFGIPGATGRLEFRLVDGIMYMNLRDLAQGMNVPSGALGEKQWLKIDLREYVAAGKAIGGDTASSITQSLQYLRGVDKDGVKDLGKASVHGTATTHYQADVDVNVLRDRLAKSDLTATVKKALSSSLDAFAAPTFRTDAWIDHQGRLRQQVVALPLTTAGRRVSLRLTTNIDDFGVKVTAVAPPANQVLDSGALSSLLSQSSV